MVQINDCYYISTAKRLCLIVEVNENLVLAKTIIKVNEPSKGYYNAGICIYRETACTYAKKLSASVFFKIIKLMEMNYNVCNTFLKQAKAVENSQFSGSKGFYWTVIQRGNEEINISAQDLFANEIKREVDSNFIDESTYNKIKLACDKTIETVDKLWEQFK